MLPVSAAENSWFWHQVRESEADQVCSAWLRGEAKKYKTTSHARCKGLWNDLKLGRATILTSGERSRGRPSLQRMTSKGGKTNKSTWLQICKFALSVYKEWFEIEPCNDSHYQIRRPTDLFQGRHSLLRMTSKGAQKYTSTWFHLHNRVLGIIWNRV